MEHAIEPDGKIPRGSTIASSPSKHPKATSLAGSASTSPSAKKLNVMLRILLDELNHRIKNLLTVVISLANQTMRTSSPEAFLPVFSQRLQGLAASHELLVAGNWQGAEMRQLVRQQFVPFRQFLDGRVTLEGPTLRLNVTAVQAIGLAIHELLTNAVKHGALSGDSGHVSISWKLDGQGNAARFAMTWVERDGPPVRKPSRRGFGHELLTKMTPQALSGEARLNYAKDGLEWTVECPARAALDRGGEPGLGDLLKSLRRQATADSRSSGTLGDLRFDTLLGARETSHEMIAQLVGLVHAVAGKHEQPPADAGLRLVVLPPLLDFKRLANGRKNPFELIEVVVRECDFGRCDGTHGDTLLTAGGSARDLLSQPPGPTVVICR